MKKLSIFLMLLALSLGLTACGQTDVKEEIEKSSSASSKKLKPGLVVRDNPNATSTAKDVVEEEKE